MLISDMEAELKRADEQDRYTRFNKWCQEVGIRAPKLEYPAIFDGGLCGVRVTEDIAHNEAMFCVPYSVIITVERAQAEPELKPVFLAHPQLFDPEEHDDWEHYILMTFMLFELQKGRKSFWYPYFEILPKDACAFWRWDPKVIKET